MAQYIYIISYINLPRDQLKKNKKRQKLSDIIVYSIRYLGKPKREKKIKLTGFQLLT